MNKRQSFLFLSITALLLVPISGIPSSNWTLQKNENGITVFTRNATGSGIKEVLVRNKIASSLSGIVALLLDSKNYTHWIYGCIESTQLKVVSETEMYNYQVTDLPWPFSDRDIITDFNIQQDSNTRIVTFTKKGIPDFIPVKDAFVRVKNFDSKYSLTPLSHDSVLVEMEMHVDPGGSIPEWLINANIVSAPYKTTVAMLSRLPQYQSASYSFIRE